MLDSTSSARDQGELASLFGEETGDRTDKFAQCAWRRGHTGVPILLECAAWVECAILERIDLGDHVGLLLDPVEGAAGNHNGLFTLVEGAGLEPGHEVD
jgi:flavin reductase (DIM6/NTAB) family NADH-FMN oxidoreductase RutF